MTGRSDDAREASGTLVWAVVDAKGWVARVWFNADDAAVDVQHMDVNVAGTPPFQVVPLVAASALASARAAGAAEAFERAAKKCDERKVFYDGLAQQSYAEAEDDAESEGAPPDTTDGEFYEEKAGVCFQLAAAIRALAGEERK